MSTLQKLAYLQKKLAVAWALGDTDTEALWQHLIVELRQGISVAGRTGVGNDFAFKSDEINNIH